MVGRNGKPGRCASKPHCRLSAKTLQAGGGRPDSLKEASRLGPAAGRVFLRAFRRSELVTIEVEGFVVGGRKGLVW